MPFNEIVNKQTGEALAEARKKMGLTQAQMANKIRLALKGNKFSSRQYQNYEAGEFPTYKTEVVKEIDKILGTHFYELLYATNIRETSSSVKLETDITEKYIKLLEQDRNLFQTVLEVNLNDISLNQSILLAQLRSYIQRDAERYIIGDKKKTWKEEVDYVNTLVDEYLTGGSKKDKAARKQGK